MKNIRDFLKDVSDLIDKKPFRLGLLLVSTLVIISASVFVYAGIPYQRSLNVGNPAGREASVTPATIMILLVSVIVSGLSVLSFRREASKHGSNTHRVGRACRATSMLNSVGED